MKEPPQVRTPIKALVLLGLLGLVAASAVGGWAWDEWRRETRAEGERSVAAALKTLASAQANVHRGDLDGNGAADYWVQDVAGLDRLVRLMPGLATADPTRPEARPFSGYWFIAVSPEEGDGPLLEDGTTPPSRVSPAQHPSRFAFLAYPADNPQGHVYMVSEGNSVYSARDLKGRPRRWPTPEELKRHFSLPQ